VPKSSTDNSTPISRRRSSTRIAASVSCITRLSVSSISSRFGSSPLERSASSTAAASPSCLNCRIERFTETVMAGMPLFCHARAWALAVRITHSPIGTISPVSSARPMKRSGSVSPRSGCCQRSSASQPTSTPSPTWMRGW
jgi:hypothetical protein